MTSPDLSSTARRAKLSSLTSRSTGKLGTEAILLTDVVEGDDVEVMLCVTKEYARMKVIRAEEKLLVLRGIAVDFAVDRSGVSAHGYFVVVAHYPRNQNGV